MGRTPCVLGDAGNQTDSKSVMAHDIITALSLGEVPWGQVHRCGEHHNCRTASYDTTCQSMNCDLYERAMDILSGGKKEGS